MSIIFNGIKTKNNIDYISFVNEDGISLEIPIEKVAADRIQKYIQRILPTSPCEPVNMSVRCCDVCKQQFRDGDVIMQTSRSAKLKSDFVGNKTRIWMVDVHENCEKNYQELLKQTISLEDVLKK